jgi:Winged helix-turn-helix DNA-binding
MIDWARAELLYRQGDISIREIARREGVSEGAVRKRAKAQGWQRETASPVRSQVRTGADELSPSSTPATAEQSRTDAEDDSEPTEWGGSEAPEWMRLYYAEANAPIRLIALGTRHSGKHSGFFRAPRCSRSGGTRGTRLPADCSRKDLPRHVPR